MMHTHTYESPLGNIFLAADEVGLTGLWFKGQKYFANTLPAEYDEEPSAILDEAARLHPSPASIGFGVSP